MAGKKRGPKPALTAQMTLKIRALVLKGTKYKDIQQELKISEASWDSWVYKNYLDFRDNLMSWRHERMVRLSEGVSEEILAMPTVIRRMVGEGETADIVEAHDIQALRVKQKESEFVRETLGKDLGYSKRNELTGKNGKPLFSLSELFDSTKEDEKSKT